MPVAANAREIVAWLGVHRRRRALAAGIGGLALVSAAVVLGGGPRATAAAVGTALADPLSVLSSRSPGARAGGALVQSKPVRGSEGRSPSARSARTVPPVPVAPPGVVPVVPLAGFVPDAPATVIPIGPEAAVDAPGGFGFAPVAGGVPIGGGFLPSVGGGIGIPGGGVPGGGPGGPGVTTPPDVGVTTPVTPVPEPATWMSMILGFGLVGWILRRRRRVPAAD